MTIHASCIALPDPKDETDWAGVLLMGPSGCGKSDLALRLMDDGARLVADDRVTVRRRDAAAVASAPAAISGLIEARGQGVINVGALADVVVHLALEHCEPAGQDRVPEPMWRDFDGVPVPLARLDFAAPSAPARVRLILRAARLGLFADAKARLDGPSS